MTTSSIVEEPHHVMIDSLPDPRLRVQGTLILDIARNGDFFVASCDQFDEYGYGPDQNVAVQDACNSIIELYWELRENQDRLGPDMERTWQALSARIYAT